MRGRRIFAWILTGILCAAAVPAPAGATSGNKGDPPELISESAVLIDADTGQVLFEKEMDKQQFPASITKIITVTLALENGKMADTITMSDEAVFSVARNTSHIALTPGEEITLEQAAYAAMMVSANDACNGIAEYVSGSIPEFAKLMTEKAKEWGAKGTQFNNANGLKDDQHYTTAYDMAMIMRHALTNETFRKIIGTKTYDMPPNNKQKDTRHFTNQHSMLTDPKFEDPGIIGGKAGYTTAAKYTLVTAAERDGVTLIAVVMKSPKLNDKYKDTSALLDYGFENFSRVEIPPKDLKQDELSATSAAGEAETVSLSMEEGIQFLLHKNVNKKDVIQKLDVPEPFTQDSVATMTLSLPENVTCMYRQIGVFPYAHEIVAAMSPVETEEQVRKHPVLQALKIIGIVLAVIVGGFLVLVLVLYIRKRLYYRKRRRRGRYNRRYK